MKLRLNFAFQAFFTCLLISGLLLIPTKGTAQSSINSYALSSENVSATTDVSAKLLYDSNTERYTLAVDNPSGKKLKIYFYAGGTKYIYRSSLTRFHKPFDLKGAEDGVYTFGIQDGQAILKTDVRIKTTHMTKREAIIASRL